MCLSILFGLRFSTFLVFFCCYFLNFFSRMCTEALVIGKRVDKYIES